MPDFTITVPDVTAATMSPNPVSQSTSYTILVTITEKTITLLPEIWYSGELYSGEV